MFNGENDNNVKVSLETLKKFVYNNNIRLNFDSVSACRTGKRDFIRFSGCYLRIESGQYPLVCPYFYHDSHCSDGFEDNEVSGCL